MAFTVLLHPKAAKALKKIGEPTESRIKEKIMELKDDPEKVENH